MHVSRVKGWLGSSPTNGSRFLTALQRLCISSLFALLGYEESVFRFKPLFFVFVCFCMTSVIPPRLFTSRRNAVPTFSLSMGVDDFRQ